MIFKKIWWDVTRKVHRDSQGNQRIIETFPEITFREQGLVNLQLVTNSALDPFTGLDAGWTFQALVDNGFGVLDLMILSDNDVINQAGDWDSSSGQADPALGQISIRLNANTTNFQNAMGSRGELLTTKLEIQVSDGTDLQFTDRMPFNTKNLVGIPSEIPAESVGNIEKVGTGASQCLIFKNDQGVVLRKDCPLGITC